MHGLIQRLYGWLLPIEVSGLNPFTVFSVRAADLGLDMQGERVRIIRVSGNAVFVAW